MKKLNEIFEWLANNQKLAYSIIRIFLGAALFTRGYILMVDPEAMFEIVGDDKYYMWFSYITIGHLVGGLFLGLGLFGRIGALVQIPILIGAVFSVHEKSLVMGGQSLELAALVLFLLVVYFIFGGGKLALGKKIGFPNL